MLEPEGHVNREEAEVDRHDAPLGRDSCAPQTWMHRALRVESGEGPVVCWSIAYFFFVMLGYFMMRPVRDAMGISGDFENLKWLFAGTLAAMLLANPLYGALVSRLPRRAFIPWVYRFFIINM